MSCSCCILFLVRVHDLILREFRYNTESPALSFDVMEGHFVVQWSVISTDEDTSLEANLESSLPAHSSWPDF